MATSAREKPGWPAISRNTRRPGISAKSRITQSTRLSEIPSQMNQWAGEPTVHIYSEGWDIVLTDSNRTSESIIIVPADEHPRDPKNRTPPAVRAQGLVVRAIGLSAYREVPHGPIALSSRMMTTHTSSNDARGAHRLHRRMGQQALVRSASPISVSRLCSDAPLLSSTLLALVSRLAVERRFLRLRADG